MKKLSFVAMVLIMATSCHRKKSGLEKPILVISTVIITDSFLVWCGNRMDSLRAVIYEQKSHPIRIVLYLKLDSSYPGYYGIMTLSVLKIAGWINILRDGSGGR